MRRNEFRRIFLGYFFGEQGKNRHGREIMIEFFFTHVPAFLTIGITVVGATLLRTMAQIYADKGNPEKAPAANKK